MLMLSACVTQYQYLHPDNNDLTNEQIYVVMDYVEFMDDVGLLMDYDLALNLKALVKMRSDIADALKVKGYSNVLFVSLSSGVTVNSDVDFELYDNRQFLDQIIQAPFYRAAEGITVEEQDILLEILKQFHFHAMVPSKEKNDGYLSRLKMFSRPIKSVDHEVDSAVLFVQVTKPRISFAKSLGVSLMASVASSGVAGGVVVTAPMPADSTFSQALLFDYETGGLIWKNHTRGVLPTMSRQSINRFFKQFPHNRYLELN